MRHAGLVELGRHHPDVVRQSAGDLLHDSEARGMDAIVVGTENPHSLNCPYSANFTRPDNITGSFGQTGFFVCVERTPDSQTPDGLRRLFPDPPTGTKFSWNILWGSRVASLQIPLANPILS